MSDDYVHHRLTQLEKDGHLLRIKNYRRFTLVTQGKSHELDNLAIMTKLFSEMTKDECLRCLQYLENYVNK